jgi:iron complex transport system substrate-binding protein
MKLKKLSALILVLLLAISVITGCGNQEAKEPEKAQQTESVDSNQGAEASAFPVTLTDADGNEITIEKKPERIVSLIPSNTEIAFALGLGEEVVGVTDFDNYPKEVETKEKIGGMEFNVEKIISLNPDLVLAHASTSQSAEPGLKQIRDAGITVLVVNNATSIEDVYQSIDLIAKATGTADEGEKLINDMKAKFAEIEEKASAIQEGEEAVVWVEVDPTLYTTGKGTFMDEMLTMIHAKNAAGDQEGWVQFTEEDAIKLNPDVIITTYGNYIENPVEQVLSRKAWVEVNAVKNKRVYDVDPDTVTRSGPRLADGVEELAKAIYPDIFK